MATAVEPMCDAMAPERCLAAVFELVVADAELQAPARTNPVAAGSSASATPTEWNPNIIEGTVDRAGGVVRAVWTGRGCWDTRDLRQLRDGFDRAVGRTRGRTVHANPNAGSVSPEPERWTVTETDVMGVGLGVVLGRHGRHISCSVETAKHSDHTMHTAREDSVDLGSDSGHGRPVASSSSVSPLAAVGGGRPIADHDPPARPSTTPSPCRSISHAPPPPPHTTDRAATPANESLCVNSGTPLALDSPDLAPDAPPASPVSSVGACASMEAPFRRTLAGVDEVASSCGGTLSRTASAQSLTEKMQGGVGDRDRSVVTEEPPPTPVLAPQASSRSNSCCVAPAADRAGSGEPLRLTGVRRGCSIAALAGRVDYARVGTALGQICDAMELSTVSEDALPRRFVLRAPRCSGQAPLGLLPPPPLAFGLSTGLGAAASTTAELGTLKRSRSAQGFGRRDDPARAASEPPQPLAPLRAPNTLREPSPTPGVPRCEIVLHLRHVTAAALSKTAFDALQTQMQTEGVALVFAHQGEEGGADGDAAWQAPAAAAAVGAGGPRRLPGLSPIIVPAPLSGMGSPVSSCDSLGGCGSPAPAMLRPAPPKSRGLERSDSRRRLPVRRAASSRSSGASVPGGSQRPAVLDPLSIDTGALIGRDLPQAAAWADTAVFERHPFPVPLASGGLGTALGVAATRPPTPVVVSAPADLAPVRPPSGRLPSSDRGGELGDVELARYLQRKYDELDAINRNFNAAKAAVHCQNCNVRIPFDGSLESVPCCDACKRYTCVACFVPHVTAQASVEGAISTSVQCMHQGCDATVAQADLRRYLANDLLERMRMNEVKRLLESSTRLGGTLTASQRQRKKKKKFPCPKCEVLIVVDDSNLERDLKKLGEKVLASPDGTVMFEGEDLDYDAAAHYTEFRMRCGHCHTVFCADCHAMPYHVGMTCEEAANPHHCRYCEAGLTKENRITREQLARAMGVIEEEPKAAPAPPKSWWRRALALLKKDDAPAPPVKPPAPLPEVRARPAGLPPSKAAAVPEHLPEVPNAFFGAICNDGECAGKAAKACKKTLPCGHACCGVHGERECLPCLHPECAARPEKTPSGDEFCAICWTETLESAPCIQLPCGHVVHRHCTIQKLKAKWSTPAINFQFMTCPLCDANISHEDPEITEILEPILKLRRDLAKRIMERMKMEDLRREVPDFIKKGIDENKVFAWAQTRLNYYQCYQCERPYFGGMRRCDADADAPDEVKREQLLCGACVDNTCCSIHGGEYIQFKCKYCCDLAVWFCWGTTHFCNTCHTARENPPPKCQGPGVCPLGGNHPPNGQEHAMGCVLCLQEHGDGRKHLKMRLDRRGR